MSPPACSPCTHLLCLPASLLVLVLAMAQPAGAADVPTRNSAPEHRVVREARGLLAQQQWEAAREALTAHVALEPTDADAFNLLGFSLRQLGRLPEALQAYGSALRLDPGHTGAHEYIGEAYIRLRDFARAQEHLEALERLCPTGCAERDALRTSLEAARNLRPAPPPDPARHGY